MIKYISQSPLIPVVLSALVVVIIILQSLSKKRFLKGRFMFSCLLVFSAVLLLVFFGEIEASQNEFNMLMAYIIFFLIDILALLVLFSTIDFSLAREKFQKTLTTNLDENKFFIFLDKKDKVKSISTCLQKRLELTDSECINKNFFDVLEKKYKIIGLNQAEANKDTIFIMIKK